MGLCAAILWLLAALACADADSVSGLVWRRGPMYEYAVRTRTLAGLQGAPAQFAGVLTRARLQLQLDASHRQQLNARVVDIQFSQLNDELPGGWQSSPPEEALRWQPLKLYHSTFSVRMRHGQIEQLLVESNASAWEINYLRAVAHPLQVIVGGEAIVKSHHQQLPTDKATHALYSTSEQTPMGKCVVGYDASPLPAFVVTANAHLAPNVDLRWNTTFVDIVKTVNFKHCSQPLINVWGSSGYKDQGPITRSATARIVAVGHMGNLEIQSTVWTSELSAGLHLRGDGKQATVWGRVNITLVGVLERPDGHVPSPSRAEEVPLAFDAAPANTPVGRSQQRDLSMTDTARNDYTIPTFWTNYHSGVQVNGNSMPQNRDAELDTGGPQDIIDALQEPSRPKYRGSDNGFLQGIYSSERNGQQNLDEVPVSRRNDPQLMEDSFRKVVDTDSYSWNYMQPRIRDTSIRNIDGTKHRHSKRNDEKSNSVKYYEPRIITNPEDVEKLLNTLMNNSYQSGQGIINRFSEQRDVYSKWNNNDHDRPRYKRVDEKYQEQVYSMREPPFNPPPINDDSTPDGEYLLPQNSGMQTRMMNKQIMINSMHHSDRKNDELDGNFGKNQFLEEYRDSHNTPYINYDLHPQNTENSYQNSEKIAQTMRIPSHNPVLKYSTETQSLINHPHGVLHYLYRNIWSRKPPVYARNTDTTTENKPITWRDRLERVKQWFRCPKPFVNECTSVPRAAFEEDKDRRPEVLNPEEVRRRAQLDHEAVAVLTYDSDFHGVQCRCQVNAILGLVHRIAEGLGNSESLVDQDTMTQFNDLVRMLRGCGHAPILKVGEMIPEEPEMELQMTAWKVFRDAVAQTGSGPALVALRMWVRSGRLSGWAARQAIAALPSAARVPSPTYLAYMFERLVSDPELSLRPGVNTSAVLAFSSLVRGAHAHGLRVDGYVAHMARQLGEASMVGDTHAIQVLIRALGKTGHPLALSAFRPYLNGLVPGCTIFQRIAMVVALQKVAQLHPEMTRRALCNAFRSRGEAFEVRVAALYILLTAQPPAPLLRRVAETARQGNAQLEMAVRAALHSAARLTGPHAQQLARDARAALSALPRGSRGAQYSRFYLRDVNSQHAKGLGYKLAFNYIGSDDELLPKLLYLGSTGRMGGMNLGTTQFAFLVSSMNKLLGSFVSDDSTYKLPKASFMNEPNFVNLGPRLDEPLEGHILFPSAGNQHFVTFDKTTILQSSWDLMIGLVHLVLGKDVHFSKMYYGPRFSFAAPDVTGHFTFFTFDSPSVLRAVGDITDLHDRVQSNVTNGKVEKATLTGLHVNMNLTWAQALRGRMGFLCPYAQQPQRFVVAFDQQMAAVLPLNATFGALEPGDEILSRYVVHMRPGSKPQTLLHYKSVPFTVRQSAQDQGEDPNQQVKIIQTRPQRQWLWKFGPNNSMDINVTAESEFLDSDQIQRDHAGYDWWSLVTLPMVHTTTQNAQVKMTFDPNRAKMDSIIIPLRMMGDAILDLGDVEDIVDEREDIEQNKNIHQSENARNNSGDREYKFETGLMIFYEDKLVSHIVRSDYASNFVGSRQNYSLHYMNRELPYDKSQPSEALQQMDLRIYSEWGNSPRWFFDEAMSADPTSTVAAKLDYFSPHQPKMHVDSKCVMSRSEQRATFLHSVGEARTCRAQMARGDLLLPACANVTFRAGFLDDFACAARFQHLTPLAVNFSAHALQAAERLLQPYMRSDFMYRGAPGEATLEVRYHPSYHGVSARLRTPHFAAEAIDIPNTRNARPFLVPHPEYGMQRRVAQYIFNYQNEPFCVLDKTSVNTFDNITYPVRLGACWYNVTTLQERTQTPHNITLQARDAGSARVLRIVFSAGSHLEIRAAEQSTHSKGDHHSSEYSGSLYLNGKLKPVTRNTPLTMTLQDGEDIELLELSMVTRELYQLNLKLQKIKILFDGLRVVLYVPNSFRGHTEGLCGTFTGEQYDDFRDPEGFIQSDPQLFASSYANTNDNCQGHAKEDNAKSKEVLRFREDIILDDVVGDGSGWDDTKKINTCEEVKGIDVYVNNTHHCFSKIQLPKCDTRCSAREYMRRSVEYHCLTGKSGPHWKSKIDKGLNINFSHKDTHLVLQKRIPSVCVSP